MDFNRGRRGGREYRARLVYSAINFTGRKSHINVIVEQTRYRAVNPLLIGLLDFLTVAGDVRAPPSAVRPSGRAAAGHEIVLSECLGARGQRMLLRSSTPWRLRTELGTARRDKS